MTTYLLKVGNLVSYVLEGPKDKDLICLWDEFKTRPEVGPYNYMDLFARHLVVNFGFIIKMDCKTIQINYPGIT